MGKPTMWFPNRSDTNQAAQAQKLARGWKFWIWTVDELYNPCGENKGMISFAVTAKLISTFVFPYADCWFSHEAAHFNMSGGSQCCLSVRKALSGEHQSCLMWRDKIYKVKTEDQWSCKGSSETNKNV